VQLLTTDETNAPPALPVPPAATTVEAALAARPSGPGPAGPAPEDPARARFSPGLGLWLLLLLATVLLPALGGVLWHLHQMRALAVSEAFAQADLIAGGAAEDLTWLMQDAQAMMASVAARPRVIAMDPARCDPVFVDFRAISPSFKALSLRRADATSICSDQAQPPTRQSVLASRWFQDAMQRPGLYATNAHVGQVTQAWTARLTYPVRDSGGTVVGLLVTPIDLKQLGQRLFGQLPSTALAALVDGSNRVLIRSQNQDERVGKPAAEGVAKVLDALRAERAASGGTGRSVSRRFVEVGIGGQRNLFVVRTVPMTDWAVVAALPEDETLQEYDAARRRSLAAILAVVAIAVGVAWRVGRAILVPIQGLASATRGLAAGAVALPVPVSGPREIRAVAREFNRMVAATTDAATELRASERQYRTLLQHLPVAVVAHLADSSIEIANDQACALLQMTPAQLRGKSASDKVWHFVDSRGARLEPSDYPVSRVLRSALALPPETLGIVFGAPDGLPVGDAAAAQRWVLVTGYPQFDARGVLVRAIVVFVDVTAQRASEHLRVAKDAAETASRAKSAFLSRVSHELRTPLNAINGFSELLLADPQLVPDARAKIGHIFSAGQHLLTLIDQVLDLTRLDAGNLPARMQALRLWPLVEQCVAICEPLAQAADVVLALPAPERSDPDIHQTWVHADPTHLRQVLMNLLSNAIKYNHPRGEVRIAMQRIVVHGGQPDIELSVTNTGAGLAPARMAGVFQPFNRLGAEDSGIAGHGLGLAISRALAQAMGGDITVRSQPGSDTCFTLLLRSAAPMPAAVQAAAGPAPAAPLRSPDRGIAAGLAVLRGGRRRIGRAGGAGHPARPGAGRHRTALAGRLRRAPAAARCAPDRRHPLLGGDCRHHLRDRRPGPGLRLPAPHHQAAERGGDAGGDRRLGAGAPGSARRRVSLTRRQSCRIGTCAPRCGS
jgi:signal transduction histidine kinase